MDLGLHGVRYGPRQRRCHRSTLSRTKSSQPESPSQSRRLNKRSYPPLHPYSAHDRRPPRLQSLPPLHPRKKVLIEVRGRASR
ncbi:hypothetical protein GALMADRAFT_1295001 [Galerina marginata CBS 339.88]|uniref:Uncharacterized protein n=1 Tax=Galerina marginata (strain CBS 339.88) TaxID=685588 RepID=A0A067T4D2_GALM3|nr:hypothetical protein GALMADRAFT_1295001 [Galerina marginata CBS 339.88]